MSWTKVLDALRSNWVFLSGVMLVPGLVFSFASIMRHRLQQTWTAAADAFIALTTLEFGILYNLDEVAPHVNPLFSRYFAPTFVIMALASVVLTIWALFIEKDVMDSRQDSRAKYPGTAVFFLWACALTLVSVNLYILAGLGAGKG